MLYAQASTGIIVGDLFLCLMHGWHLGVSKGQVFVSAVSSGRPMNDSRSTLPAGCGRPQHVHYAYAAFVNANSDGYEPLWSDEHAAAKQLSFAAVMSS